MNKKYIITGVVVVCVGILVWFGLLKNMSNSNNSVACTMEAMICPDGSAVGRSGPHCEFAPCPTATTSPVSTNPPKTNYLGYLEGLVTLSPTCPVERIPRDPACDPKPYPTLVTISGKHNFFMVLHADSLGVFRTPLPVGTYTIMTSEKGIYPSCGSREVMITERATTTIDVQCDTGIR